MATEPSISRIEVVGASGSSSSATNAQVPMSTSSQVKLVVDNVPSSAQFASKVSKARQTRIPDATSRSSWAMARQP
eukprot:760037-Hanusia_phi.AAC.1